MSTERFQRNTSLKTQVRQFIYFVHLRPISVDKFVQKDTFGDKYICSVTTYSYNRIIWFNRQQLLFDVVIRIAFLGMGNLLMAPPALCGTERRVRLLLTCLPFVPLDTWAYLSAKRHKRLDCVSVK